MPVYYTCKIQRKFFWHKSREIIITPPHFVIQCPISYDIENIELKMRPFKR